MSYKMISNNLRKLREERGIKQKFIAKQLGITANYYSQIENGHRLPQVEHLLKLRNIFNISLDEIFFDKGIANCDKDKQAIGKEVIKILPEIEIKHRNIFLDHYELRGVISLNLIRRLNSGLASVKLHISIVDPQAE